MKPSEKIIDFIAREEGFRQTAYKPLPTDRYTIGYGSTYIDNIPVKQGDIITEEKAHEQLKKAVNVISAGLNRKLDGSIVMTQYQYDAVISLIYNIGLRAFLLSATGEEFRRGVNIAHKFSCWVFSGGKMIPGLMDRRQREAKIYGFGVYQ